MKKGLKRTSILVIALTFLCLFGYASFHVANGGQSLGVFTEPFKKFITFPQLAKRVLLSDEIKGISGDFTYSDPDFVEVNNLDYDVYGLNAFISASDAWQVRLFNFKDDSVLHQWELRKEWYPEEDRANFQTLPPDNPVLMPKKELVALLGHTRRLMRVDSNSNIIWENTKRYFHHSLNLDFEDNIWVCTSEKYEQGKSIRNNKTTSIRTDIDDFITKVDSETGAILFDKSLIDIFMENDMAGYIYGHLNAFPDRGDDLLHLNDIQPVLEDSEYWRKGDLWISLRHRSLVFLYRPATNVILKIVTGPFINQHDVDVISDHEISIFNNNVSIYLPFMEFMGQINNIPEQSIEVSAKVDVLGFSHMIVYDLRESKFSRPFKHQFDKEQIITLSQGLLHRLDNGDLFVESQNEGKLYIFNENEIVMRKAFSGAIENRFERPHWIRIYQDITGLL